MQHTRYATTDGEELIFQLGGYGYAWCDETVKPGIEKNAPLSFSFAEVNQAYARSSYDPTALVMGQWCGVTEVHAGGRPVLVEVCDVFKWPKATERLTLAEDGKKTTISCSACPELSFESQTMTLDRPGVVTISRKTSAGMRWFCHGNPSRHGNTLQWPDGTRLSVVKGKITLFDPTGYAEEISVGYGLLKMVDPMPVKCPLVVAEPENGELVIEIRARMPDTPSP
jgi:hypothetical protein